MSSGALILLWFVGIVVGLTGTIAWKGHRKISLFFTILVFLGVPLFLGANLEKNRDEELMALRADDPERYLEEIKNSGNMIFYNKELLALKPDRFEAYAIENNLTRELLDFYKKNNRSKYLVKLSELVREDKGARASWQSELRLTSEKTYYKLVAELSAPLYDLINQTDDGNTKKLLDTYLELASIDPENEDHAQQIIRLTGKLKNEEIARKKKKEREEAIRKEIIRKQKIEDLYKEARRIPASKYKENMKAYEELNALDPKNELFKKKFEHYRALYVGWLAKNTFTDKDKCKAGISVVYGRPVGIMKVYKTTANIYFIKYRRSSDNTVWRNKCMINGSSIGWGAADGRWRTHVEDGRLSYSIHGEKITVTFSHSDGSKNVENFYLSQFR